MEKEYYKTWGLVVNTPTIDNLDYEFEYHTWQYDTDPYLSKILMFLAGINLEESPLNEPINDNKQ